jgi:putative ABC transport system substrate-binding protein
MRRRDFLSLVGGATLAWPIGSPAQEQGRIYRVAMVLPVGRDNPASLAFLDELLKEGFAEGRNLVILGGTATSNERVAAVVPAILDAAPDLILTGGDPIARAFQKATQSVPILAMTEDLVGAGFAASLARPGGNITGINLMSPDLDGKRQDILIEAVPNARRIAALADSNVASLEHVTGLERSAQSHGKELLIVRASTASEIIPAMTQASMQGAGALNVLSSPMLQFNRRAILDHAITSRLPAIYQWPETAIEGGLLGYGPSFIAVFRQRARMAIKVLRGARPAELPVEQPSLFQLIINLRTARAMDIAIPAALELRADRLIE